jgi:hypothetical protein
MKMTSKSTPNLFALLIMILGINSMVSCTAFAVTPTTPVTTHLAVDQSSTTKVTLTPEPLRTATDASNDQAFLDAEKHSTRTLTPTSSVTAEPSRTAYPSPTLPPACGTVQLGKAGTQTKESNHPVLIEGTAIFCNHSSLFDEEDHTTVIPLQQAMLDLDSGSATIETTADIGFGVFGRMRFYAVVDINNALATFWSLNGLTKELPPQPTFDQCQEQVNLFSNDNEPLYVCVITNEGHVARVKVEKYNPLEQVSSVEISFITWQDKVENP